MQVTFSYSPEIIRAIECALSPERFNSYLNQTHGDKEKAAQLYIWNAAVSEGLYLPLQMLEVTIRNALHNELTREHGTNWFHSARLNLAPNLRGLINEAEQKLVRQNKIHTPGGMVSELSFGFWTGILGGQYEVSLWRPCLHKAFRHAPSPLLRRTVHKKLVTVRQLRNRIAHHEPIFRSNLVEQYESILELLSWTHPEIDLWVRHHCRFNEIWSERPQF